jgi:hypothetical protein
MKLSDYVKGESKYLKADDLPLGKELRLTISKVELEVIENDDGKSDKAVLYFAGKEKGLVLNATNGKKLIEAYGDDTAAYTSCAIVLYRDTVAFKGQTVPCLRVRIPGDEIPEDDIPF